MKTTTINTNNENNEREGNAMTANTKTKKTEKKTTFADLLREYEKQAANTTTTAYHTALTNLSQAATYGVLKKCIDVSGDKTLTRARADLARDMNDLQTIEHAMRNAYATVYDTNGNAKTVTVDSDLHKALTGLCAKSLGDGIDIMHTATVAILEQTDRARNTPEGLTGEWMERRYEIRRLKRKVWIKTEDSVNGWETVETSPIQEVYKAIRRYIDSSKAVKNASDVYTYLDDEATDTETGVSETIFRRFGKYADIGGAVRDYNGKEWAYTADRQTAIDIDALVERLALSATQAKVLQLRMSGYGYKAIATYLGVEQGSVQKHIQRIREKAKKIGLTPDGMKA